jgi:hypothetical protein
LPRVLKTKAAGGGDLLLYIHVHKNVVLKKLLKKIEAILNSKP